MRYRKLSPTGDYTFGNGELDFLRDTPATVAQAVQTAVLLWLGEWYLNIDNGTPFLQGVFGKHSKEEANLTLQDRILNVQNVTGLENFASVIDPVSRRMSLTATLNTAFGPTPLQVSNYANF